MKKLKKFHNDLDSEETTSAEQADASNETLVKNLQENEDPNVLELIRRFLHALECLAQPSLYHRKDVDGFVRGDIKALLPRFHQDDLHALVMNHLDRKTLLEDLEQMEAREKRRTK